jgi:hypothetical protein
LPSRAKIDDEKFVSIYEVQQAVSTDGPWTNVLTDTPSVARITGLTSGNLYYFRVRAKGAAGYGAWSDLCSKRAT